MATDPPPLADDLGGTYVSTGVLPSPEEIGALIEEAHQRFLPVTDGANSAVYPALERQDPSRFGLSVVGATGRIYEVGDARVPFTIMSVAKPFVFALVCAQLGAAEARRLLGANATGLAFNSVAAVERSADGRTNPMVNAGAIAATALVAGATADERWETILAGLSAFAGRALSLDEEVLASARATNSRNQAIARLLQSTGALEADPAETVDVYTRQSCLSVTAVDLATMGATLADGGVNPVTGEVVVDEQTCRHTLAVMTTAGLYETSGDWLYDVGLPGKSGIGGGIITISPGKGGLATYSPPLDAAGNSVRGQLAATFLSRRLGLDLFASTPVTPYAGDQP